MGNSRIIEADLIEGLVAEKNYVSNLGEKNTAGWVVYNDGGATPARPVDGTAGTPTAGLAVSITTTTPISDDASFLFSKPASNCQGQGFSFPFTVDLAARAKVMKIEFDYMVASGTFNAGTTSADSDLIVYIYDVDAAQLIEPSSFKLFSNSTTLTDKFSGYFQTSATSTNYRLIFHVASTNASAWALEIDNISVSKSQYVYGTPITDWVEYTPTFNSGFALGTGGYSKFYWRRVGDSGQYKGSFKLGTTGQSLGSGILTLTIPAGQTFDDFKMSGVGVGNNGSSFGRLGWFNTFDAGGASSREVGNVLRSDNLSNTVRFLQRRINPEASGEVSSTFPFTWGATDEFFCEFSAPIQGWSSSVRMSDGFEARDVLASGTFTTASLSTTPTFLTLASRRDTVNMRSGNQIIIRSSGFYQVNASICGNNGTSTLNDQTLELWINSAVVALSVESGNFIRSNHIEYTDYFVAGTVIEFRGYVNTLTSSLTQDRTSWSVIRKESPQTTAQGEVVACRYFDTAALTPGGSFATRALARYITRRFDTHNMYDTATGIGTIPVAGVYNIEAQLLLDRPTGAINNILSVIIEINGSPVSEGYVRAVTAGSTSEATSAQLLINLNSGDTFRIMSYVEGTSPLNIANALVNYLHVSKVG